MHVYRGIHIREEPVHLPCTCIYMYVCMFVCRGTHQERGVFARHVHAYVCRYACMYVEARIKEHAGKKPIHPSYIVYM